MSAAPTSPTDGSHTGGCQCGAVRYRIEGPLDDPHLCHCRMCQKAAGNFFMPLGGVAHEAFTLTRGAMAWFASSGPVRRGFCRDCGTPLAYERPGTGRLSVTLGSLDDPAAVPPVSSYGSEARMPWLAQACAMEGTITGSDEDFAPVVATIRETSRQHPDHDTAVWPRTGERQA